MLALCGLGLSFWLLYEDKVNNDGVLSNVNKGETINDLLTSPLPVERRHIAENAAMHDNVKDYLLDKDKRNALKRSMAKNPK